MDLNAYQVKAMQTCMESCDNISYMLLNLQAEVGELSGKIAKAIRKGNAEIKDNKLTIPTQVPCDEHSQLLKDIQGELGDVLWQLSGVCKVLGYNLNDIAQQNLKKLADRQQRGVIEGNGDYR